MHATMVADPELNYFKIADKVDVHHSTISRLLGPDEHNQWLNPRPVNEATLYKVIKLLGIPTDDALPHVKPVAQRARKLDAAERELLLLFNRVRAADPDKGARRALARLKAMAIAAENYAAEAPLDDSDPDFSDL
jgi:hypothetical protein